MKDLALTLQTTYADLLDKLLDEEIQGHGGEEGGFVSKLVKGKVYWYYQRRAEGGGYTQRYVGPETPELLTRIQNHKKIQAAEHARRDMVRALVRSGAVPAVNTNVGRVLQALADSGVFRVRAVLVGTVAYQTYGPMLGVRLGSASVMTEDIDVAQFRQISVAVEEKLPPILETLRKVDPSFEPISRPFSNLADAYVSGGRLKVEFLTPMKGRSEDGPAPLPSLGTASQPLRFLDYLIFDERKAVVLHGAGILVNVPDPARYAWHKLIVSVRRQTPEKVPKDLTQAETLLSALIESRPDDVRDMWKELARPGRRSWQSLALSGLQRIRPTVRDRVLEVIGRTSGRLMV